MFRASMELESDISRMGKVDVFLETIMQDFQIEENYFGILSFPLQECVKNAIIHGNQCNNNKKVYIHFTLNKKKMYFSIKDEGKGFDYQSILTNQTLNGGLAAVQLLVNDINFSDNGSQIHYSLQIPCNFTKRNSNFLFSKEIKLENQHNKNM